MMEVLDYPDDKRQATIQYCAVRGPRSEKWWLGPNLASVSTSTVS